MLIQDIKKFTEDVERLNGLYAKQMESIGVTKDFQEFFFSQVRKTFDSKMETVTGEPIALYAVLIRTAYYELAKKHRNQVSKWNKKVIRNRGNLVWDGKDGQKTNVRKD